MAKKKGAFKGGGLTVALALAAIYFSHPDNPWLFLLGGALFLSLMYTFSNWYARKGLSTAEYIARPVAACAFFGLIVSVYTAQFWQRITVNPTQVSFQGYPNESFTFSIRNERSDDIYDVQVPFLIGSHKHLDDKFSVKVMPNGDPPQRIHLDYNYCYGTKGDGVVSHVQPNEREVLIVHIIHIPAYGSGTFSITYSGGDKITAEGETPTFDSKPRSYSAWQGPTWQGTVGVRGDYRICKYAMSSNGGL